MLTYQSLLEIGLSPDAETLQQRLVAAAAELGFGLAAGVLVRGRFASGRAAVRPFGNTPAAFVEASRTLDIAVRDPLLASLLGEPALVAYDQAFYVSRGAAELWDVQAQFGYREGMAVSLHESSHAEVFSFGVDGQALPSSANELLLLEADLRLIALHAQAAAQRIYFPETQAATSALAKHEAEALKWASDGVAVWVMGDKMRISNRGVEELLTLAQRKLGAASPAGAVLRAIEGGLLDR